MIKKYLLCIGLVVALLAINSCQTATTCQNSYATNYNADIGNNSDPGTCQFSRAIFFIMADSVLQYDTAFGLSSTGSDSILWIRHQYIHIDASALPIQLFLDNAPLGQLNHIASVFPNACDTSSAQSFPLTQYAVRALGDSAQHTWTAVGNGNSFVFSGTVRANSSQICIPVSIK